jgi:hypothetical protein
MEVLHEASPYPGPRDLDDPHHLVVCGMGSRSSGTLQKGTRGLTHLLVTVDVDVLYAASQAHETVNAALHREYSPGIVFIFSLGRKYLFHV